MRKSSNRAASILLLLSTLVGPASAAPAVYSVTDLPLEKVAEDLSVVTGVPIVVADAPGVIVRNWTAQGAPAQMIADLARRAGLHFNFDGASFELVSNRSLASQVVKLEGRSRREVVAISRQAFPAYSREAIRWVTSDQSDFVVVRGSRRFIDTIAALLKPCVGACRKITIVRSGRTDP